MASGSVTRSMVVISDASPDFARTLSSGTIAVGAEVLPA
jgi:hypothetical protein